LIVSVLLVAGLSITTDYYKFNEKPRTKYIVFSLILVLLTVNIITVVINNNENLDPTSAAVFKQLADGHRFSKPPHFAAIKRYRE